MTPLRVDDVLDLERRSIRAFVESCSGQLAGRHVLDYGCGQQPYRDVVEAAGGVYEGYDRAGFPANVSGDDVGSDPYDRGPHGFDAVLCNQMIQYVSDPLELLRDLRYLVRDGGVLVLTGPTNWRVLEPADLFRFTVAGARSLVERAGFTVVRAETRASVELAPGFDLPLGWGVLAEPTAGTSVRPCI